MTVQQPEQNDLSPEQMIAEIYRVVRELEPIARALLPMIDNPAVRWRARRAARNGGEQ